MIRDVTMTLVLPAWEGATDEQIEIDAVNWLRHRLNGAFDVSDLNTLLPEERTGYTEDVIGMSPSCSHDRARWEGK